MATIVHRDGHVVVHFTAGPDDQVLGRVRGWVYWQELRVLYARDEDGWKTQSVELVAPAWAYETVVEIISGRVRPDTGRHEEPGTRMPRRAGCHAG